MRIAMNLLNIIYFIKKVKLIIEQDGSLEFFFTKPGKSVRIYGISGEKAPILEKIAHFDR